MNASDKLQMIHPRFCFSVQNIQVGSPCTADTFRNQ
jgi:hypothetical protein